MKVNNLKITSFRGIKGKNFNFGTKENCFVGSNGVGKSTCLDAIVLLLCGETYTYDKDMSKNRNLHAERDVQEISMTVETDEETFNEDGKVVKVEKEFACKLYENYKGKKGEKTDEYVGFKTDWYINGRKVTNDEYFKEISNTFNIVFNEKIKDFNLYRFLIDYDYSTKCKYESLKKFIEAILNVKSDMEILKDERFRLCAYDISQNNYDPKAVNSQYNAKIKLCDKELDNQNAVLSKLNENNKDFEEKLNTLSSEEEISQKIANIQSRENISEEETKKLADLELEISNLKQQLQIQSDKDKQENVNASNELNDLCSQSNDMREDLAKVIQTKSTFINEGNAIKNKIDTIKNNKCYSEKEIERLTKDKETIENKQFKSVVCSNCGFELNSNEREEFEKSKQEDIENLSNIISQYKKSVEENDKEIEELNNKMQDLKKSFLKAQDLQEKISNELTKINEKISALSSRNVVAEESKEVQDLRAKINAKKEELENYKFELKQIHELTDFDKVEIDDLKNQLKSISNIKYSINNNNRDIIGIESKIKNLLDEKCKWESKQIALEEFKEYKTQLIKENTQKIFGDIEWVLQEESKLTESSKKDKCYAKLNDVSMDGVNTASKLVLGVKIIECVKNDLGIKGLPIVFDIVDNIGRKALNEIETLSANQIFCTKASFDENVELNLVTEIK